MAELRMFKYPIVDTRSLCFDDTVKVLTGRSVGVQRVEMQGGFITLWCLVDTDDSAEFERTFHVVGTGEKLWFTGHYLGTVFDRQYVWHIFESFPAVAHG